jgi:hypothetical protein
MTRSLAVDANNDLTVGPDGYLTVATGLAAVTFAAAQAAKALRGEMVLAMDQGIPYFDTVWNGRPNISQFEAALRARLLAVEGVTDITSLTTAQRGDALTYAVEIQTAFGPGTING